jgi:tetratricopeptide (TPR) repeat protein
MKHIERIAICMIILTISFMGQYAALAQEGQDSFAACFNEAGWKAFFDGDATAALKSAACALEKASTNDERQAALILRGRIVLMSGNFEAALKDINDAAAINPNNFIIYAVMGNIYVGLDHPREAIDNYNQALALLDKYGFPKVPENTIYNYAEGDWYSEAGRFGHASIISERGQAYFRSGNIDMALSDLTKAVDLGDPMARYERGNVYYKLRDYDHAEADYAASDFFQGKTGLSLVYADKGKFDKALETINAAMAEITPEDAAVFHYVPLAVRAYINVKAGNTKAARTDINQALALTKEYDFAFYVSGLVYAADKNYRAAIEDYQHSLRIDARNADAYYALGQAYDAQEDTARVRSAYCTYLTYEVGKPYEGVTQRLKEIGGCQSPDAPRILQVNLREQGKGNKKTIYQDIDYYDPNGDAAQLNFRLIASTMKVNVGDGRINASAEKQKAGDVATGTWGCGGNTYSVTVEVVIIDKQGNSSNAVRYTMNCR